MEGLGKPILTYSRKSSVRILRPGEYTLLRDSGAILPFAKAQMDGLLYPGMRYVEAQRLFSNPSWFDGDTRFIHLPPTAVLKGKRRQLNRYVRLNPQGTAAVWRYLSGKGLPGWETWAIWLKDWAQRCGLDPAGLGPKTLRKTWESWNVFSYPEHMAEITLSQGHTTLTAIGHYLNMPFTPEDKAAMLPYVEGMF